MVGHLFAKVFPGIIQDFVTLALIDFFISSLHIDVIPNVRDAESRPGTLDGRDRCQLFGLNVVPEAVVDFGLSLISEHA